MAVSAVDTKNWLMSSPGIGASESHPSERGPAIERLLFVSDVPVADVDEHHRRVAAAGDCDTCALVAHVAYAASPPRRAVGGTTSTGTGAAAASAPEIEPSRTLRSAPRPREPTTIILPSSASARCRSASTGSP
jgi:hypothetical protein